MFELADPIFLILLPLPYFVRKYGKITQQDLDLTGLRLPFTDALEHTIKSHKITLKKNLTMCLLIVVWSLTILAVSGPRWVGKPFRQTDLAHQLMLVLDVSPSMGIVDRVLINQPVNRLTLVKKTALNFLKQRSNDRIGLILFGSKAFVQTPLTYDHQHLMERLKQASVGLLGQSTAIGDALGLAIKNMKQKSSDKVVILLTDGANNAGVMPPVKAASLASEQGIKLYIIGLDETKQDNIFGSVWGINNSSDLDEKTLKKMVKIANGKYFRATDLDSLAKAYYEIDQLSTVKYKGAVIRPQIFYYHWILLLIVIIFFMVSLQRFFLFKKNGEL